MIRLNSSWRTLRRRLAGPVMEAALRLRAGPCTRGLLPKNLVVLAYHRIDDPRRPGFYGFSGNVSATRQAFSEQLDLLAEQYTVVGIDDVVAWRRGLIDLPRNPVLITFDDGYRDNFTDALPELAARRLPAVLFVCTGYVDGTVYFWWDWVADVFARTKLRQAVLPLLGNWAWENAEERSRLAALWVNVAKRLPQMTLRYCLRELAATIGEEIPERGPSQARLTWDELKVMTEQGFMVGAHTVRHPNVNRISEERARKEIATSRAIIEQRLGISVDSFAYPYGGKDDFNERHERILEQEGFALGFRLDGGITFAREVRRRPFAVRRVCITQKDTLPRFAAKVAGASRFASL
ncbi:MAG: polysaccharide deacetylase family protein [Hyphomicrobiaceae bacterium]